MLIPLYILGLLVRVGPQHGYQIRKIFEEQLSDFVQIKLSNIYYHLEKMESQGLLAASAERNSNQQERTVYSITDTGRAAFSKLLGDFLDLEYQPLFAADAVLYFSNQIDRPALLEHLEQHVTNMRDKLAVISKHKEQAWQGLPATDKEMAAIIFDHHARHYQAELNWARETLADLQTRRSNQKRASRRK